MKVKTSLLLILAVVLFNRAIIYAQKDATKINVCQPSVKEILFAVNPVENWNPSFEQILVAGEFKSTGFVTIKNEPPLLTQLAAMMGEALKTARFPIYIIRKLEDKKRIKIETDINAIKRGEEKDIKLKRGDIVFLSQGCSGGKLLPSKPMNLTPEPPKNTDLPLPANKRIT